MTGLGDAYQVLSDCPHCHTEAAVVELMDPAHPACHLGAPMETRCRLCAWKVVAGDEPFTARQPLAAGRCPACRARLSEAARTGQAACPTCGYKPRLEVVREPESLADPAAAAAALARWAAEEGEPDVEAFCRANMGKARDEVIALLGRGERVPTTFDVIAYLFPQHSGGRASAPDPRRAALEVVDREPEPPPEPSPAPPEPEMDPRTPARVLVSVMVADGELRHGEHRFVQAFLDREGLPSFAAGDLRVWRPAELGPMPPPELRDRLLEACVHLSHLDRERDGSEWKVITAFARAWGVSDAQLRRWDQAYDAKYATVMTRLWRSLSQLVRPR